MSNNIGGASDASGVLSCLDISLQESTLLYFSLSKLIPNGKSEYSQLSVMKDEQKCIMNAVSKTSEKYKASPSLFTTVYAC